MSDNTVFYNVLINKCVCVCVCVCVCETACAFVWWSLCVLKHDTLHYTCKKD